MAKQNTAAAKSAEGKRNSAKRTYTYRRVTKKPQTSGRRSRNAENIKIAFLGGMKTYKDDEIDFVGVCTGICVISNVLLAKAAVPETKICVIENACACVTPESHKTAIEAMKTCQVDIIQ